MKKNKHKDDQLTQQYRSPHDNKSPPESLAGGFDHGGHDAYKTTFDQPKVSKGITSEDAAKPELPPKQKKLLSPPSPHKHSSTERGCESDNEMRTSTSDMSNSWMDDSNAGSVASVHDRKTGPSKPKDEENTSSGTPLMKKLTAKLSGSSDTKDHKSSVKFRKLPEEKTPFVVKYVKVHGESEGAYKNDSQPRGLVLMFNFEKFENNMYEERRGSKKDFDNLASLFRQMGYNVSSKWCSSGTITKAKFMADLDSFVNYDHKAYDAAIVIIMSHGAQDKAFYTSDGIEIELMTVYDKFSNTKCLSLTNKPKIFIFQFCRLISAAPTSPRSPSMTMNTMSIEYIVQREVNRRIGEIELNLRRQIEEKFSQMAGSDHSKTPDRKISAPTSMNSPTVVLSNSEFGSNTFLYTSQNSLAPNFEGDRNFERGNFKSEQAYDHSNIFTYKLICIIGLCQN